MILSYDNKSINRACVFYCRHVSQRSRAMAQAGCWLSSLQTFASCCWWW